MISIFWKRLFWAGSYNFLPLFRNKKTAQPDLFSVRPRGISHFIWVFKQAGLVGGFSLTEQVQNNPKSDQTHQPVFAKDLQDSRYIGNHLAEEGHSVTKQNLNRDTEGNQQ